MPDIPRFLKITGEYPPRTIYINPAHIVSAIVSKQEGIPHAEITLASGKTLHLKGRPAGAFAEAMKEVEG